MQTMSPPSQKHMQSLNANANAPPDSARLFDAQQNGQFGSPE
jgi:hypothetical protein